mgnify:CR=1 FL=1
MSYSSDPNNTYVNVGKYKAMKYILTGELFSAREALEMGLASEVVPDPEVEGRAIDLARQIAAADTAGFAPIRLDAALVDGPLEFAGLDGVPLCDERLVLITEADLPRVLEQLGERTVRQRLAHKR